MFLKKKYNPVCKNCNWEEKFIAIEKDTMYHYKLYIKIIIPNQPILKGTCLKYQFAIVGIGGMSLLCLDCLKRRSMLLLVLVIGQYTLN